LIIECNDKSSTFNRQQADFVKSFAEEFLTTPGPGCSLTGSQCSQLLLTWLDRWIVVDNALQLAVEEKFKLITNFKRM
jgi:hypothetical protein